EIQVTAARANVTGNVSLETPAGWSVEPASQPLHLAAVGDHASFRFTLQAPKELTTAKIVASAEIGGVRYRNERTEINYRHIPRQLLQPLAAIKAVTLNLAIRGKNIGYLSGAGDSIADNLKQMGYLVKTLDDADLTAEKLSTLDAIVI